MNTPLMYLLSNFYKNDQYYNDLIYLLVNEYYCCLDEINSDLDTCLTIALKKNTPNDIISLLL